MNRQTGIGLTIAVGVALVAIVLWLPRKSADAEQLTALPTEAAATDDPVEAAVQKVSGENPMEGILALRALAESDPPNVDAVVWLGIFGIQSGQLDKARERFSEALTLEPGHLEATWQLAMLDMEEGAYDRAVVGFETVMGEDSTYANGLFFTARCYEAMGKTEAALIRYNEYLPYAPDTVVANRVQDFITRLEFGTPAGTNE
ncbi:MAG: tetratricopeptide repeat protein [Flavobacteriales bacterium]|nr:tetratricopeptide repeat protein [Bacteroidota bacterium]